MLALASWVTGREILEAGIFFHGLIIFLFFVAFNQLLLRIDPALLLLILANALLLCSPLIIFFSFFLSEGPFMIMLLWILLLFQKWIPTQSHRRIILIGILSGVLFLTRFAGIGFLLGFGIYLLFFLEASFRNRLKLGFFFSLFSTNSNPWFLYTYLKGASGTDRDFSIHLILFEKIWTLISRAFSIMSAHKGIATGLLLSFVAGSFIIVLKRKSILRQIKVVFAAHRHDILIICLLQVGYLLFLAFSIFFLIPIPRWMRESYLP